MLREADMEKALAILNEAVTAGNSTVIMNAEGVWPMNRYEP